MSIDSSQLQLLLLLLLSLGNWKIMFHQTELNVSIQRYLISMSVVHIHLMAIVTVMEDENCHLSCVFSAGN